MLSVCSISLGYSTSSMCGVPGEAIDSGYACQACRGSSTHARPRCMRVVTGPLSTGRGTLGSLVHDGNTAILSHHFGLAGSISNTLCQLAVGELPCFTGATTTSCTFRVAIAFPRTIDEVNRLGYSDNRRSYTPSCSGSGTARCTCLATFDSSSLTSCSSDHVFSSLRAGPSPADSK